MNGCSLALTFRRAPLALAGLALAAVLPASASTYHYRQVIPGLVASPAPQAQEPVAELLVALASGNLPAAMVGQPYSYDLKQLLSITGESNPDKSAATWSVVAGALPTNLALSPTGEITGTPTAKNEAGASFEVKASYKGKDGQHVYTIVVNGAVLQATQISFGTYHACAVTTAGGVKCWGKNDFGQLGTNDAVSRSNPTEVQGLPGGIVSVAAGQWHTCALTGAGGVLCWGRNNQGQLGNKASVDSLVPVEPYGLGSGVAVITAGRLHTCAVTTTGGAKCWGYNGDGQLGDTSTSARNRPTDVYTLTSGVASISAGAGGSHTCAVTTAGGAKCWGAGGRGQLGVGSTSTYSQPLNVEGMTTGVRSIHVGSTHTCALTTAGAAKCWGSNDSGEVGVDPYPNNQQSRPVQVTGLSSGVLTLAAGHADTCAVLDTGTTKCWGGSGGYYPKAVSSSETFARLSIGTWAQCGLTTTGRILCWGQNAYGQLGDGTTTQRNQPTEVSP